MFDIALAGVVRLKQAQDSELPIDKHYIRSMIEIDSHAVVQHDEDDFGGGGLASPLRMIVCMSKSGSQRLLRAQYLQSDIGFKRVVGFYEFELAAMDRDANTSKFDSPL